MAYSSTLSTRMWNCSAVRCSAEAVDPLSPIGCKRNFPWNSEHRSLLVPLFAQFVLIEARKFSVLSCAGVWQTCLSPPLSPVAYSTVPRRERDLLHQSDQDAAE